MKKINYEDHFLRAWPFLYRLFLGLSVLLLLSLSSLSSLSSLFPCSFPSGLDGKQEEVTGNVYSNILQSKEVE